MKGVNIVHLQGSSKLGTSRSLADRLPRGDPVGLKDFDLSYEVRELCNVGGDAVCVSVTDWLRCFFFLISFSSVFVDFFIFFDALSLGLGPGESVGEELGGAPREDSFEEVEAVRVLLLPVEGEWREAAEFTFVEGRLKEGESSATTSNCSMISLKLLFFSLGEILGDRLVSELLDSPDFSKALILCGTEFSPSPSLIKAVKFVGLEFRFEVESTNQPASGTDSAFKALSAAKI